MAFLGLSFVACALLIIGMPPLSGFIAKLSLIGALLDPGGLGVAGGEIAWEGWLLIALLILSGLASLMAMVRVGVKRFWTPRDLPLPALRRNECIPIVLLLGVCVALTIKGDGLLRYAHATAVSLDDPAVYIDTVLATRPVPNPAASDSAPQVTP
jgi:multicomponent K+:H+ antiporter subunit D